MQKQVLLYSCATALAARKIAAMESKRVTNKPISRRDGVLEMPPADLGPRRPDNASDMTASAAEEVRPPLPIISEHALILGTVAATAVSPTFEGELDSDDDATNDDEAIKDGDAIKRAGWIATLWRRVAPARNQRPPRRHYPKRLDGDFIADARLAREMYRL